MIKWAISRAKTYRPVRKYTLKKVNKYFKQAQKRIKTWSIYLWWKDVSADKTSVYTYWKWPFVWSKRWIYRNDYYQSDIGWTYWSRLKIRRKKS